MHKSKGHAKKPAPVAEVPQAPTAPPTLEQQPPVAPQISYQGGQLAINSTNATLSQVLRSVQLQTGASIDIPPGAGNERVVAKLGPGKPKDVLASLLNGSKFNYVLLGDPHTPGGVQKIILLTKSNSGGDSAVATAQNNMRPPQPSQAIEPPEDEYQQNDLENENPNPPLTGPNVMPSNEGLASSPEVINPAGRTPEQMLQELQRMQQQQQQMQQQLNPANQQQPNPETPVPTPFPSQPLAARPHPQ